jgi:hypothetical protein
MLGRSDNHLIATQPLLNSTTGHRNQAALRLCEGVERRDERSHAGQFLEPKGHLDNHPSTALGPDHKPEILSSNLAQLFASTTRTAATFRPMSPNW